MAKGEKDEKKDGKADSVDKKIEKFFTATSLPMYYRMTAALSSIVILRGVAMLALQPNLYTFAPKALPSGQQAPCPYTGAAIVVMCKASAVSVFLGLGIARAHSKVANISEREMFKLSKSYRVMGWFAMMGPFWFKVCLLTSVLGGVGFFGIAFTQGGGEGESFTACRAFPSADTPWCAGTDPALRPIDTRYIYQVGADLCTVGWGGFVIIDGVIFAVAVFLPIFVGLKFKMDMQVPPYLYCPLTENAGKVMQFIRMIGP
jgi:hypothetical protein